MAKKTALEYLQDGTTPENEEQAKNLLLKAEDAMDRGEPGDATFYRDLASTWVNLQSIEDSRYYRSQNPV